MGAHLRVNIHAMSYLTKAAVPHMEDGSAIINTASMSINADKPNSHPARLCDNQGRYPTSRRDWGSCLPKKAFARMPSRRGLRFSFLLAFAA